MTVSNTFTAALAIMGMMAGFSAQAESVDDIMVKVDHMARKSYSTQVAKVKLTTCNYKTVKGKMKCVEKPRVVLLENAKKIGGMAEVQDRSLAIVLEPVADKGIGLLTFEYEKDGRDNDNWIYLTEFAKVNRIIANPDDGGSVFGSEFSLENTENPEARKLHEYDYKIIEEKIYQNRPVWVVEMHPKADKANKTRYEKITAWVDRERYIALKENYYRNGKLHKQRTQKGIKEVDGVWIALKVTMNNYTSTRVSQMSKSSVAFNIQLDDEYLTQRSLTDFAFRERNLASFRKHFN